MKTPMNQTTFYEAFAACNPFTGLLERWMGTATLETIRRHGLFADLSYPLHGDEAQGIDGWGCRSAENRF
jgi:hypothetical protein